MSLRKIALEEQNLPSRGIKSNILFFHAFFLWDTLDKVQTTLGSKHAQKFENRSSAQPADPSWVKFKLSTTTVTVATTDGPGYIVDIVIYIYI